MNHPDIRNIYYKSIEFDGMNIWQEINLDDRNKVLVWHERFTPLPPLAFYRLVNTRILKTLHYEQQIPYYMLFEPMEEVERIENNDGKAVIYTKNRTITIDPCLSNRTIEVRYGTQGLKFDVHPKLIIDENISLEEYEKE